MNNKHEPLANIVIEDMANEMIRAIDDDVEYWLLVNCSNWTGIKLSHITNPSNMIVSNYNNWLKQNCIGKYKICGGSQIAFEDSKDATLFSLKWL